MSMKNFLENLENKASSILKEDAYQIVSEKGKKWVYVPKQTFLNGLLKVAVEEVSDNKWRIYYCSKQHGSSKDAIKGGEDLMAHKEIAKFMTMINEEVEGSPNTLKGWAVKGKPWEGSFEKCLEKCVNLMEGKSDDLPSGFKTK